MHKLLILAVFVFVGAVLVFSERCHHYNDCTTTQCSGNDTHVICEHDGCTCVKHLPCDDVFDCTSVATCQKHDHHQHCLDGMCLCLKDDVIDRPGN